MRLFLLSVLAVAAFSSCTLFSDPEVVSLADAGGSRDSAGGSDGVNSSSDAGVVEDTDISDVSISDVGADTSGPADMSAEIDMAPCSMPIVVASLQSDLSTPNTLRWEWSWVRDDVPVDHLEIITGPTQQDVLDETSGVIDVYTPADNGELVLTDPDVRRINWSSTWRHEADTEVWAKLKAVDANGCTSETLPASGLTAPQTTDEHIIFSEQMLPGFSIPMGFFYSSRKPQSGVYHYEWDVDCMPDCFELVRQGGMSQTVAGLDSSGFADAYLSYWLLNTGSLFAAYPVARIAVNDGTGNTWYKKERITWNAPSSEYRLYQIPLSKLEISAGGSTDEQIPPDVFVSGTLTEFGVGTQCEFGSYVGWDDVRIIW